MRQLMHAVESAAIFADSDVVTIDDFQLQGRPQDTAPAPLADLAPPEERAPGAVSSSVREAVGQVEEQLIREAMQRFGGNKKRVAGELGISRSYLYKRLANMGIG